MTKYKIVGIIDLLLGISQLLISVIFPVSVFAKLSQMYVDFGLSSQPNLTSGYFIVMLILIMAVVNLFLGIKILTGPKKKEKFYKYGLIFTVATFFLTGILISILNFSVISPIYNLAP